MTASSTGSTARCRSKICSRRRLAVAARIARALRSRITRATLDEAHDHSTRRRGGAGARRERQRVRRGGARDHTARRRDRAHAGAAQGDGREPPADGGLSRVRAADRRVPGGNARALPRTDGDRRLPDDGLGHGDGHGNGARPDGRRPRAAEPVDEGGADGPDQGEGDEEGAPVEGALDADVAHSSRPARELVGLAGAVAEELDQHGARHVEALGHRGVHRCVQVEALAGHRREAPTDALGRDDEDREHQEGQQGQSPLEEEHGDERGGEHDEVRHDRAERGGDGALRADHVVVDPAHQGAGLGAGEEGDGHGRHVVEEPDPQVVDQALPDAGRVEALHERQRRGGQRGADDERGQHGEHRAIGLRDGHVDDAPQQQRRDQRQQGLDDDHGDEADQRSAVGGGEGQDPADRATSDLDPLDAGGVGAHEHVRRLVHHQAVRLRRRTRNRRPRAPVDLHRAAAESVGFEPTVSRNPQRLSRPPHSSALATLRRRPYPSAPSTSQTVRPGSVAARCWPRGFSGGRRRSPATAPRTPPTRTSMTVANSWFSRGSDPRW